MQWLKWFAILLVVAVGTALVYHTVEADWVAFRRASRLAAQGDRADAAAILERLRGKGFRPDRTLPLLADIRLGQNQPLAAAEAYRELAALVDDARHLDLALAGAYARGGRFADAAQTYRRVLAANPSDRTARIHLARVLTALGRFDKAAEQYRLVLGETP